MILAVYPAQLGYISVSYTHLIDFSDGVTSIYGGNATGKTTIADAFFWLLFDKDSAGRADFNIKPLSATGEVADSAAFTEVEGIIEVDGADTLYKKTLRCV